MNSTSTKQQINVAKHRKNINQQLEIQISSTREKMRNIISTQSIQKHEGVKKHQESSSNIHIQHSGAQPKCLPEYGFGWERINPALQKMNLCG